MELYDRLTKIDDLTRPDHSFLDSDDVCYYMGEYTARGGFGASPTNDLIINLKKPMDRRGRAEWKYKGRAIKTAATDLRGLLKQPGIERATFVPVPPSKVKSDPLYDDRLSRILTMMAADYDGDIRELVFQRENMPASHESDDRATIPQLVANYSIDEALVAPPRNGQFVIFDDMLTTGRHLKAMQQVLSARFPETRTAGLFVARRAPDTDELDF